MNNTAKLEKLRQRQEQIAEAIRAAEAVEATRQRKEENRAKFILGSAILSLPAGEREALLPMVLDRLNERDRHFITVCLSGELFATLPPTLSNSENA